jgi:hypothetical protein
MTCSDTIESGYTICVRQEAGARGSNPKQKHNNAVEYNKPPRRSKSIIHDSNEIWKHNLHAMISVTFRFVLQHRRPAAVSCTGEQNADELTTLLLDGFSFRKIISCMQG